MEESLSPEHEHELPAGQEHLVHLSVSGESVVTDVEDRVILGLKEQGEVGGKMVVYKDFTVERLCSQYFGQLHHFLKGQKPSLCLLVWLASPNL